MRARFSTMAGVDAMQLKTLLRRSTLSREDRQIAVCLLQWDMNYIDVGAKMVYEKQLAKLSRHCAQTRAMLDAYNK